MSIIDSVKNTAFVAAVNTVLNYLEKDPEANIPKAMSLMDKVLPDGWYEGQRAAFRQAIEDKGNWYQLILKAYQLDEGVRKAFFQNFIINSALKGTAIQNEIRERENCNVPWAILLDPTSACNLHCTGCWAAEYGHKLNLSLEIFMAYHDGQPFNKNMLRPCPMLENPQLLREMVKCTGAKSTDLQSPESVDHLCDKCELYAEHWKPTADELWAGSQKGV